MFAEVKNLERQLDNNEEKIKQLAFMVVLFFLIIGGLTWWITELEDEKERLMNKVTSMQIQVAKCEVER